MKKVVEKTKLDDSTKLDARLTLDDRTKLIADILYKEIQRVQATSTLFDEWLFKFLSVGVLPFIGFLAYAFGKPEYRSFLAALPVLSLLGAIIASQLMLGYLHVGAYMRYLEARLAQLFLAPELCNERFAQAVHSSWVSPVRTSGTLGLLLLVTINIATGPTVDACVKDIARGMNASNVAAIFLLQNYWLCFSAFAGLFVLWAGASWVRLPVLLRRAEAQQWKAIERAVVRPSDSR